jgi:hypothetical protein
MPKHDPEQRRRTTDPGSILPYEVKLVKLEIGSVKSGYGPRIRIRKKSDLEHWLYTVKPAHGTLFQVATH